LPAFESLKSIFCPQLPPRSRSQHVVLLIFYFVLFPCVERASAQDSVAPTALASSNGSFPDTAEGLRQFLSGCIVDAKSNNKKKLDLEIAGTEIPDYAKWLVATWPGQGPSWVEPYGKNLSDGHTRLRKLLVYLAHEDGELVIRKVNDEPQGGKGMEWGMLQSMAQPVDIFYASWKNEPGPAVDGRDMPIGYFFYVNGGFRWDSLVTFPTTALVSRVDAVYPYPADGKHPTGAVILRFRIARNGSVQSNSIEAVQNSQSTTDGRLIKAAANALTQWKYRLRGAYDENEVSYARIVVAPPSQSNPTNP
jgi:hypothetical protein